MEGLTCIHGIFMNDDCRACHEEECGKPSMGKAHPPDLVNCPPHYRQGEVECIDAIQSALTPEEFIGYCKGQVMKYTWRSHFKGKVEDLKKARWYLNRILGEV